MDYEHKMNYDAALPEKTPDEAVVRNCGHTLLTADELRHRQTEAKEELNAAIADVDTEKIISLRNELDALPIRVTAAKITETKKRLEEIETELSTNEENLRLIRAVQLQRKNQLLQKLEEIQPYRDRYNECDVQTSYVNNDIELLRMERREKKSLLFSLSESIKN